jgi:hypothetical protein
MAFEFKLGQNRQQFGGAGEPDMPDTDDEIRPLRDQFLDDPRYISRFLNLKPTHLLSLEGQDDREFDILIIGRSMLFLELKSASFRMFIRRPSLVFGHDFWYHLGHLTASIAERISPNDHL